MISDPYVAPSSPSMPFGGVRRHLASSVCTWAAIGAIVALAQYALAIFAGLSVPLVYSFPSFYPLRGVFNFDVLYGFCIQCVLYGIIFGACNHASRRILGVIVVAAIHAISVVVCPMLT